MLHVRQPFLFSLPLRGGLAVIVMALLVPGLSACSSTNTALPSSAATPDGAHVAHVPLRPQAEFAHYPAYRGTLGTREIVLRIGVKPDDPEGLNGEYQYLPDGPVVLIAGAREGKTLKLEESDDGTEISGQWVAFYAADGSLSGARLDNDASRQTPFSLRPVAP